MEEKLISVIVPIYNCEKYIERCIDSLLKQTYKNLEIILIDDGSTDNSRRIIDEYSKNDTRIKVFHQENGGVANARNKGIEMASGDYIAFVDSDDSVKNEYLSCLCELLGNADIAVCGYYLVNSFYDVIHSNISGCRVVNRISANEYIEALFDTGMYDYQGYPVNKLFIKEIIQKNNIWFNEKIRYNEDRLFVLQYLIHCKDVVYSNIPLYMYVNHSESAVAEYNSSPYAITELYAFELMLDLLKNKYNRAYVYALFDSCYSALLLRDRVSGEQKKEINKYLKKWQSEFISAKGRFFKVKVVLFCRIIMDYLRRNDRK